MDGRNDAIVACDISSNGSVSKLRLLGNLDPKPATKFDLVTRLSGADVSSLIKQLGEKEKTAGNMVWNNRLAGSVQHGLLREFTKGRSTLHPIFSSWRGNKFEKSIDVESINRLERLKMAHPLGDTH